MKTDLGAQPFLFPMPVLMIGTYNEDDSVDVMNMAWGGICGHNMVALNVAKWHKTADNVVSRGAFTLSIADEAHLVEADFFGLASSHKVPDKFARSGLTAVKSALVDAPVIQEFPLTLECRVLEAEDYKYESGRLHVVGEILNVLAEESILDAQGHVSPAALHALVYDHMNRAYYAIGDRVGNAWKDGNILMQGAERMHPPIR